MISLPDFLIGVSLGYVLGGVVVSLIFMYKKEKES